MYRFLFFVFLELSSTFSMKYLGQVKKIFGVEVVLDQKATSFDYLKKKYAD